MLPGALSVYGAHHTDVADRSGETALHQAARAGYLGVVKQLLENKAELMVSGNHGTALQVAQESGHKEIIRALRGASSTKCCVLSLGSSSAEQQHRTWKLEALLTCV